VEATAAPATRLSRRVRCAVGVAFPHLLAVTHDFRRKKPQFYLVGIKGIHEKPLCQHLRVVRVFQSKDDFVAGVGDDRIVHGLALRSGLLKLSRELVGEGQMQPEATRLVQIFGDGRCDKFLTFIDVDIEGFRLFSFPLRAGARDGPEVGKEQRRVRVRFFPGDLASLGREIAENDVAFIESRQKIEGFVRLTQSSLHDLGADKAVKAIERARELCLEFLRIAVGKGPGLTGGRIGDFRGHRSADVRTREKVHDVRNRALILVERVETNRRQPGEKWRSIGPGFAPNMGQGIDEVGNDDRIVGFPPP